MKYSSLRYITVNIWPKKGNYKSWQMIKNLFYRVQLLKYYKQSWNDSAENESVII